MNCHWLVSSAVVALTCLVASPASAAPPKAMPPEERLEQSPRHHEWVDLRTESDRTVRAFLVFPEVDGPVPAVVVIHENRGLNAWARSMADQVAEAGYVAIAPDMLSGKGPEGEGTEGFESSDAARTAIYQLSDEEVREALDAAVRHVRGLRATNDRVAVAGFCWGGGKAFDYAAHNPNISAAFVFYGTAPDAERMRAIGAPVYGFYGGDDFRITGQLPDVRRAMSRFENLYLTEVYEGAGHGFMRSGEQPDAEAANREARDKAWERWQELLGGLE